MTNLLDLDSLSKVEKSIILNGKEYAVKEMTVESFIAATKEAQEFAAKGDESIVANLEATCRMLRRTIPDLSEETIRSLDFNKLKVLVAFVQGEVEEASEGAPEGNAQKE
jgi:hypothetical protein